MSINPESWKEIRDRIAKLIPDLEGKQLEPTRESVKAALLAWNLELMKDWTWIGSWATVSDNHKMCCGCWKWYEGSHCFMCCTLCDHRKI